MSSSNRDFNTLMPHLVGSLQSLLAIAKQNSICEIYKRQLRIFILIVFEAE